MVKSKEYLESKLSNGVWNVIFIKRDQSIRTMICTRDFDYISKSSDNWKTPKGKRVPNKNIIVVWDLEKDMWRSFRIQSILSIKLDSKSLDKVRMDKGKFTASEIKSDLSQGIWNIKYTTLSGITIETYATRDFSLIPLIENKSENKKSSRKIPEHQIIYWDVKKGVWRSFISSNLISMRLIEVSDLSVNRNIGIPQDILESMLNEGYYEIIFIKRDGSLREMICTRIPKYFYYEDDHKYSHLISVYDLQKRDIRNIRYDSILSVKELKDEW
jgi:hypothetical protein